MAEEETGLKKPCLSTYLKVNVGRLIDELIKDREEFTQSAPEDAREGARTLIESLKKSKEALEGLPSCEV